MPCSATLLTLLIRRVEVFGLVAPLAIFKVFFAGCNRVRPNAVGGTSTRGRYEFLRLCTLLGILLLFLHLNLIIT